MNLKILTFLFKTHQQAKPIAIAIATSSSRWWTRVNRTLRFTSSTQTFRFQSHSRARQRPTLRQQVSRTAPQIHHKHESIQTHSRRRRLRRGRPAGRSSRQRHCRQRRSVNLDRFQRIFCRHLIGEFWNDWKWTIFQQKLSPLASYHATVTTFVTAAQINSNRTSRLRQFTFARCNVEPFLWTATPFASRPPLCTFLLWCRETSSRHSNSRSLRRRHRREARESSVASTISRKRKWITGSACLACSYSSATWTICRRPSSTPSATTCGCSCVRTTSTT